MSKNETTNKIEHKTNTNQQVMWRCWQDLLSFHNKVLFCTVSMVLKFEILVSLHRKHWNLVLTYFFAFFCVKEWQRVLLCQRMTPDWNE